MSELKIEPLTFAKKKKQRARRRNPHAFERDPDEEIEVAVA